MASTSRNAAVLGQLSIKHFMLPFGNASKQHCVSTKRIPLMFCQQQQHMNPSNGVAVIPYFSNDWDNQNGCLGQRSATSEHHFSGPTLPASLKALHVKPIGTTLGDLELPEQSINNIKKDLYLPTIPGSKDIVIHAPDFQTLKEIVDVPFQPIRIIEDPDKPEQPSSIECRRMHRMLHIRKRKMQKHRLKKRLLKNAYQIAQSRMRRRTRKAMKQKMFIDKVIKRWEGFNAKNFVKVLSVEDLYNIPKTDYIDKKAGYASDEDWAEILKRRRYYYKIHKGLEVDDDGNVLHR